jgi:hypothetical protein
MRIILMASFPASARMGSQHEQMHDETGQNQECEKTIRTHTQCRQGQYEQQRRYACEQHPEMMFHRYSSRSEQVVQLASLGLLLDVNEIEHDSCQV